MIESPGGYARSAYQIATLFRRHCGGFDTVVPAYPKSAATYVHPLADDLPEPAFFDELAPTVEAELERRDETVANVSA